MPPPINAAPRAKGAVEPNGEDACPLPEGCCALSPEPRTLTVWAMSTTHCAKPTAQALFWKCFLALVCTAKSRSRGNASSRPRPTTISMRRASTQSRINTPSCRSALPTPQWVNSSVAKRWNLDSSPSMGLMSDTMTTAICAPVKRLTLVAPCSTNNQSSSESTRPSSDTQLGAPKTRRIKRRGSNTSSTRAGTGGLPDTGGRSTSPPVPSTGVGAGTGRPPPSPSRFGNQGPPPRVGTRREA
mmetsp:Transcript_115935/g.332918  ORF Transcript_115935/g.332918 Transcript_115935/m.332918 type:complete len:243 (-) Transcript_115935:79-807(-)